MAAAAAAAQFLPMQLTKRHTYHLQYVQIEAIFTQVLVRWQKYPERCNSSIESFPPNSLITKMPFPIPRIIFIFLLHFLWIFRGYFKAPSSPHGCLNFLSISSPIHQVYRIIWSSPFLNPQNSRNWVQSKHICFLLLLLQNHHHLVELGPFSFIDTTTTDRSPKRKPVPVQRTVPLKNEKLYSHNNNRCVPWPIK